MTDRIVADANETPLADLFTVGRKVAVAVSAHADDETLGCGGTLIRLQQEGWQTHLIVATIHDPAQRRGDYASQSKALSEVTKRLGVGSYCYLGYTDTGVMQSDVSRIAGRLRTLFDQTQPSVVFCPHVGDLHSDHRYVAEAVHVATRMNWSPGSGAGKVKAVLAYEIVGNSNVSPVLPFTPNVYVDIGSTLDAKSEAMAAYTTELYDAPHARSAQGIVAHAHSRGHEACVYAAEAFVLVRWLP